MSRARTVLQTGKTATGDLRQMLTVVLERAAGDGISIVRYFPQGTSGLKGIFAKERSLLVFELNWADSTLSYKLIDVKAAQQILKIDEFPAQGQTRTDKADKCFKGVSCGAACIQAGKMCRLKASEYINPREMALVKQHTLRLQSSYGEPMETYEDHTRKTPDRTYRDKSIRDLQRIARERNVYRTNHMNKDELVTALETLDKDPGSQDRLRKTLDKERSARRQQISYVQKISKTVPGDPAGTWLMLKKLAKVTGIAPEIAIVATGAFLASVGVKEYRNQQDRYRTGFQESAQMAYAQAIKMPLDDVEKDNILFTVDGFSRKAPGSGLQGHLESGVGDDEWLHQSNHIITLKSADFDVPPAEGEAKDAGGTYQGTYVGDFARKQFGKYFQNVRRGRNQAAVDLAAQLYAYGSRYPDKPLNVLSHAAGGNVTNEALEILHRIQKGEGGGKGADMISRLNVVHLGTPDFGVSDSKFKKTLNASTIVSPKDPFAWLPHNKAKWVSSVKGGEIEDYMNDDEVRNQIRTSFGYYDSSLNGQKQEKANRSAQPSGSRRRNSQQNSPPEDILDDFLEDESPRQATYRTTTNRSSFKVAESETPDNDESSSESGNDKPTNRKRGKSRRNQSSSEPVNYKPPNRKKKNPGEGKPSAPPESGEYKPPNRKKRKPKPGDEL